MGRAKVPGRRSDSANHDGDNIDLQNSGVKRRSGSRGRNDYPRRVALVDWVSANSWLAMGFNDIESRRLEQKSIEWATMKYAMHWAGITNEHLTQMGLSPKLIRHLEQDDFGYFDRDVIMEMTATTIAWSWSTKNEREKNTNSVR
jgi:hypothetical protein